MIRRELCTESKVREYLLTYAELNCFYITCGPTIGGGLIGYVDRSGSAWILMEDDDNWVDACIVYLKSQGTPVFENPLAESQHIESIQEKRKLR